MNRKSVLALTLGILAAAIACVIAGMICYFTAARNAILLLVGIFMMIMGSLMATVPLILLALILISAIHSKRNK